MATCRHHVTEIEQRQQQRHRESGHSSVVSASSALCAPCARRAQMRRNRSRAGGTQTCRATGYHPCRGLPAPAKCYARGRQCRGSVPATHSHCHCPNCTDNRTARTHSLNSAVTCTRTRAAVDTAPLAGNQLRNRPTSYPDGKVAEAGLLRRNVLKRLLDGTPVDNAGVVHIDLSQLEGAKARARRSVEVGGCTARECVRAGRSRLEHRGC
jgi:hypothetical protein